MWAVMCVCRRVCHTQAQSCLSTRWALNRYFAWVSGTAAVLAQGGGGVHLGVVHRCLTTCSCHGADVVCARCNKPHFASLPRSEPFQSLPPWLGSGLWNQGFGFWALSPGVTSPLDSGVRVVACIRCSMFGLTAL